MLLFFNGLMARPFHTLNELPISYSMWGEVEDEVGSCVYFGTIRKNSKVYGLTALVSNDTVRCASLADKHDRREKLSNEKINAYLNRARSTFKRFRKSQPYKIGQNMVGDFEDLDLYLQEEQGEAIDHCLQEIGCND